MRRKPNELIPIERSILEAALQLHREGIKEFHGIQIAGKIKDQEGARLLTGYGTLYRALGRLQQRGILQSRWEELLPTDGNRPRHRYYQLVGEIETTALENPAPHREYEAHRVLGLGELQA